MPRDDSEPPVQKMHIFREQALQAWRGQEAERRVLLDLSPLWMQWALGGILVLAALGVLLAGTTSIPKGATSTASARLNNRGDTVFVDAVFVLPEKTTLHSGQIMSFRPQDLGGHPIDLAIVSVTPYRPNTATPATTSATPSLRVLVHAATPTNTAMGDARSFTGPAASGTAHVLIGTETLLHLLRPRSPVGGRP